MTTAVKVDEDAKSRLEELQAEIRLETGKKVTQQELLSRLMGDAYGSKDNPIKSFRESTGPLTASEKGITRQGRFSSGVGTDEGAIGDTLYE